LSVRYSRETLHARPFYDRVVDESCIERKKDNNYVKVRRWVC